MKSNQIAFGVGMGALVCLMVLLGGCTSVALTCEDQSRDQLSKCNTDCGEGIASEFCKTGCTIAHNDRLEQCQETR